MKKKPITWFNDKNLKTDNKNRGDMIDLWCDFSPYQCAFFYNNPIYFKNNRITPPLAGKINLLGKQFFIEMRLPVPMTDFVLIIFWVTGVSFKAYYRIKDGKESWVGFFEFEGNKYTFILSRNKQYYFYFQEQAAFIGRAYCEDKELEAKCKIPWDIRLAKYISANKKKNEYKAERYRYLKKELPF